MVAPLSRLVLSLGPGAVICLYPEVLPIDKEPASVPVGIL